MVSFIFDFVAGDTKSILSENSFIPIETVRMMCSPAVLSRYVEAYESLDLELELHPPPLEQVQDDPPRFPAKGHAKGGERPR